MTLLGELFEEFGLRAEVADAAGAAATFFVTLIIVWLVAKAIILPLVNRLLARRDLDTHARRPIEKITWFLVIFGAFAIAIAAAGWGSALRSLATIAAAGTLAVGFALQNVIKNFVAGIFIYAERPFKVGDWIEWNDQRGIVEDISLRVTRVRTFDNELLTVANSVLSDNTVKNVYGKDRLRLTFTFGIGYSDDIDAATEAILDEATSHPAILDDPEPSVRVTELADSYVGLQGRVWVDDPRNADPIGVRSAFVQSVKQRFDEEDIEIPFPQRDLSGAIDVGEMATRTD